ncbi:flagellar biosynthesis repressor FlbT [Bradyrhizobium sp. WSM 1704]|uniref:flagellar biosynthesis repressor FlbT n=1 Tax=Bradyrhizobium semiaridum TaxID=2821404 RepID=UPI001CE28FAB|nr:flagellar biosynthesis repressor FlbT [Bradyrhizobium semiaridum]MCA6123803.1 flagellar biosynthesis repressor FlbT [Bradyrhizobium semiaridum]
MKVSLRAGERIYVNGAVLRVDRKVQLELVNDVMFLLEAQVMQAADATTALRQLYFIVQLMLMNPTDVADASALYRQHHAALRTVCENRQMLDGLAAIDELVGANRYYEALKRIRALFPVEQAILSGPANDAPFEAA